MKDKKKKERPLFDVKVDLKGFDLKIQDGSLLNFEAKLTWKELADKIGEALGDTND